MLDSMWQAEQMEHSIATNPPVVKLFGSLRNGIYTGRENRSRKIEFKVSSASWRQERRSPPIELIALAEVADQNSELGQVPEADFCVCYRAIRHENRAPPVHVLSIRDSPFELIDRYSIRRAVAGTPRT
jgi:hypothetical protein